MTSIDLLIDPLAANALGYWKWESGGPFYGIPWSNFLGWFVVSLILFALARQRAVPSPHTAWIGLSVILFFTVIALGLGLILAGMVGVFLIILHGALFFRATRQSARNTAPVPPSSASH